MALDMWKFFRGPSRRERLTARGLRPDVVEATLRMVTDDRSDPTLTEIQLAMQPSEAVLEMMEARYRKYLGITVLTTRRVLFAGHQYRDGLLADVNLTDVLGVSEPKKAALELATANGPLLFDRTLGISARLFGQAVVRQQGGHSAAVESVVHAEGRDPLEVLAELRALRDAGVMTPAQFEAEKAKLVADL